MPTRRRYTKSEKTKAVILAEATSNEAAAEALGYPRKSIAYWRQHPDFAAIRHKTQEERVEGWRVVEWMVQDRLIELIPTMDAKEAIVTGGVATDKIQLLTGGATARTENVSITDGLDAEQKRQLRERLLRSVRGELDTDGEGRDADGTEHGLGSPSEGRTETASG